MREGVGAVVLVLAAACAVGGPGSGFTTFGESSPGTTANDATASSGASTASDGSPMGSGGDSTSLGTTSDEVPEPSSSSVGDTETVDDCDAILQTFAADPGWVGMGLPDGGTVFEWTDSAYAGGGAGEVGGTLQRGGTDQYYADTMIEVASGDCITAQGRLVAPTEASDFNSVINFGHFSSGGGPHIGFSFGENPNETLRVYLIAGSVSQQVFVIENIATPRTWSYAYDPVSGMMTLEMEGLGSESVPVTAEAAGDITAIDAFGMFKTPHETPEMYTGLLEVYLDELTYTR